MCVANGSARWRWFKEGYEARQREESRGGEPLTLGQV